MRIHFICLLLMALSAPTFAKEWQVAWSDDFEQDGLPDPAKWDYEVGFVRNNEVGYYTRDRSKNVRIEGGVLVIEAHKEKFPNARPKPASTRPIHQPFAEYTSGSLTTRGKFAFTYGRVEVEAKLPRGSGVWPAIWTLGEDIDRIGWPACGEIDIMELFGQISNRISSTLHFKKDGKHHQTEARLELTDPGSKFRTYAIEWDENSIACFVDDQCFNRFDLAAYGPGSTNPFHRPHFLILNVALANNLVVGKLDESVLPQQMLIRSVRVLKKPTTRPAANAEVDADDRPPSAPLKAQRPQASRTQ